MTLAIAPHAPSTSGELVDTGFGFLAHRLRLSPYEWAKYDSIMAKGLGAASMSGAMEVFRRNGDRNTLEHGKRVASLALGTGIRLGLPDRDMEVGVVGNVLHDFGSQKKDILAVRRSPYTFAERPDHQITMQGHVKAGYDSLTSDYPQLGPNVPLFAWGHHGKQGDRPPYGLMGYIAGLPEWDGYVPDIDTQIGLTALADPFDGMTVTEDLSGRHYQHNGVPGYGRAVGVMMKVDAPYSAKQALLDVVEPSEVYSLAA